MNAKERGEFLCCLRKDKGLTQQKLGELINYTDKNISKWELGKSFPKNPDTLKKIAELFEITVEELIAGKYKSKDNEKELSEKFLDFFEVNYTNSHKTINRLLIIIFALFIACIFSIYFLSIRNKTKFYKIFGISNNGLKIELTLFTSNKVSILNFNSIDSENIKKITLYYKINNEDKIVLSTTNKNYILEEREGEKDNLKKLSSNPTFIKIEYEDEIDIIKLKFIEKYTNDNIFSPSITKSYLKQIKEEKYKDILLDLGFKISKECDNILERSNNDILYVYELDINRFSATIYNDKKRIILSFNIKDNYISYEITENDKLLKYGKLNINENDNLDKIMNDEFKEASNYLIFLKNELINCNSTN